MRNVNQRLVTTCVIASIAGGMMVGGCSARTSSQGSSGLTSVRGGALTSSNGLWANGLTSNGLWANGLWANGLWANGLWANGLWANGLWANGLWANGLWANGLWANGRSGNGLWANGLWANGLWANGLAGNAAIPGNTLRSSAYARELLQYIYSCAMPPAIVDTVLDPNKDSAGNGGIACSNSDTGVASVDAQGNCDPWYECVNDDCVVPLRGAIGLAINDDGTTWWGQPASGGAVVGTGSKWGDCDETCQRWVSSCVLARTNAYGEHVEISMRAPKDAPLAIRNALTVSSAERNPCPAGDDPKDPTCGYTLREGAYYGNIFATTPIDPTTGQPATYPGTDGPASGPIADTPSYYACAGPGSNIPEVTLRFCSSQGDQAIINVPGVCLTAGNDTGVCLGEDTDSTSPTFGAIQDCYTSTNPAPSAPVGPGPYPQPPIEYTQVITVYLKALLSTCGNGVCEAGESSSANPAYCPSDCRPGGWARNLIGNGIEDTVAALQPDGTVVVAANYESFTSYLLGKIPTELPVDDSVVPPVTLTVPSTPPPWLLEIAKYSPSGSYVPNSGQLYTSGFDASGLTAASDGSLLAAGVLLGSNGVLLAPALEKFAPDGSLAGAPWPFSFGSTGPGVPQFDFSEIDPADGSILLAGTFAGTATVANLPPMTSISHGDGSANPPPFSDTFVMKLSAQGQPLWTNNFGFSAQPGFPDDTSPTSLAIDPNGDALIATSQDDGNYHAYKLDGSTGAVTWQIAEAPFARYFSVASDENRNAYVTGEDSSGYFLASYTADGAQRWIARATESGGAVVVGLAVAEDHDHNVVVAGYFRGVVDFGFGAFNSYASAYPFVAAYKPDGTLLWSKQIPTIISFSNSAVSPAFSSAVMSMAIDSSGHVVMTGTFGGSMEADGYLLVNTLPEVSTSPNAFVASFVEPSTADTTPPAIGTAAGPDGLSLATVPKDIMAQATSPSGATVFFTVPTAIDNGDPGGNPPGTQVSCSPGPKSTFRIGTTPVTCTAADPFGHSSTAGFNVVVSDTLAPVFSQTSSLSVQAVGATSAAVTATDAAGTSTQFSCSSASPGQVTVGQMTGSCSISGTNVTLTVVDLQGSVLSPTANIAVGANSGTGVTVTYPFPAAMDQVDLATPVTCLPASGTVFPVGTTQVSCTTSDKSSNQAQQTFTVTVTPPPAKVSCMGTPGAPVVVSTSPGVCGASIGDTGVAGTCSAGTGSAASCTFDGTPLETLGPGHHAIVVVGTAGGATATCTSYVQVTDNQDPVATCSSQTVQCTGNGGTTLTPTASCTDNCGCTTGCATALFPLGTSSGSCTATDSAGNSATCQPTVTVVDSTPPVITPRPGPSQLQCDVDRWTDPGAVALDVCVGDLSGSVQTIGTIDPTHVGSYTETYASVDPSGNKGSATRTVGVVDTLPPTLTLNSSAVTLQCGVDHYMEVGAKATDVCAGDLTSAVTESGTVKAGAVGPYTVTYTVTDPSGNTASLNRSINVVDTQAPSTTATVGPNPVPNRYINIDITSYTVTPKGGGAAVTGTANCWTSAGLAVALKAADACALKQLTYTLSGAQTGSATVASGSATIDVTKSGSTTVTYYATDNAGNAEATKTLPVFVGAGPGGLFGFSCAPSASLKNLPSHGTVTGKGTVSITNSKTGKTLTQSFSFTHSY